MLVEEAVKALMLMPGKAVLTLPGGAPVGELEVMSDEHVQIHSSAPAQPAGVAENDDEEEPVADEPPIVNGSVTITPPTGTVEALGN